MNKRLSRLLAGALAAALLLPGSAFAAAPPLPGPVIPSAPLPGDPIAGLPSIAAPHAAPPGNDAALSTEQRAKILLDPSTGITSIQYAMMNDGEVVESGTAGVYSKKQNRALTKDNLYCIGSTSKMFTTAAVMRLVDQGKIQLDAPVTTYVPDFKMADERYKQITVRMLLNHSSGLMGTSLTNGFLFDDADTQAHDSLLDDLSTQVLKADPGAFSVYCNDGFTLAEIVVERVSGMSFTDYIHKEITAPLGMTHTKTMQDDFDHTLVARTYNPYNPSQETPTDSVNLIGTGGIYSTAEDQCRFAQIYTGEKHILSDSSRKATMNPEYKNGQWLDAEHNIISYGLGWDAVDLYPFSLYGIKALTKGGDTLLMHNSLIVLPEYGLSAAVSTSGGSSALCQMLATNMLLDQLEKEGIISERKSAASTFTPAKQHALDPALKKYEGLYASSTVLMQLKLNEVGILSLTSPYDPEQKVSFLYCGDGVFKNQNGLTELRFLEENGNTYLTTRGCTAINGLGDLVSEAYYLQKLPENKVSPEVEAAWAKRQYKTYIPLTDKYTSQSFMSLPAIGIATLDGYLLANPIVDENLAGVTLKLPMMGGRDTSQFRFETVDGVEYLYYMDAVAMNVDAVPNLYVGARSHLTIQPTGYNRWFNIPAALGGKTLTVQMPKDAGFVLYDAKGKPINQSAISGNTKVKLPADGVIVFCGEAGDRFNLAIS